MYLPRLTPNSYTPFQLLIFVREVSEIYLRGGTGPTGSDDPLASVKREVRFRSHFMNATRRTFPGGISCNTFAFTDILSCRVKIANQWPDESIFEPFTIFEEPYVDDVEYHNMAK